MHRLLYPINKLHVECLYLLLFVMPASSGWNAIFLVRNSQITRNTRKCITKEPARLIASTKKHQIRCFSRLQLTYND